MYTLPSSLPRLHFVVDEDNKQKFQTNRFASSSFLDFHTTGKSLLLCHLENQPMKMQPLEFLISQSQQMHQLIAQVVPLHCPLIIFPPIFYEIS